MWTLIITVIMVVDLKPAISTTSITDFESQKACADAGVVYRKDLKVPNTRWTTVVASTSCVQQVK